MAIAWGVVSACNACGCKSPETIPTRDDPPVAAAPSQRDGGAAASRGHVQGDCNAYCSKLTRCFPGATRRAHAFQSQCLFDCKRAHETKDDVALFYASVASCHRAACGEDLGACVVKQMNERVPADRAIALDVRGLPGACANMRACVDADSHIYVQKRLWIRSNLYKVHRPLFRKLPGLDNAELVCRHYVDNEQCSGRPAAQPGVPIAIDCDQYCDKQKACFPTYAKAKGWDATCRTDCEREAKEGTTVAGFFAAVAACKTSACGLPLGACVAEGLGAHWPNNQPAQWDVRGLPPTCMHIRACQEAMFVTTASANLTREASYKRWAKVFATLASEGTRANTHCEQMVAYSSCH